MVCSTTLSQGDPAESIQAFIKKYCETFDTALSPTHVNHYDSIKILADVIGRVGNDHDAIRDALAVLDFEGALGHYQADSEGNLVHTIHTQVFKDGAWQLLLTEEYPVE